MLLIQKLSGRTPLSDAQQNNYTDVESVVSYKKPNGNICYSKAKSIACVIVSIAAIGLIIGLSLRPKS